MTRALRLEFDDRDDPIVEVAAAEEFKAADFLSAVRRRRLRMDRRRGRVCTGRVRA